MAKLEQIDALRRAGKKQEADILASGGRLRQAEKIAELANRVDASGFTYTGNTYTLRPGEDYYSLAQRLYGNSAYFSIIAKYNSGLIPKAGMTIKIPVIRATGGVAPAETAAAPGVTTPTGTEAPSTGLPGYQGYNVQAIQGLGGSQNSYNVPGIQTLGTRPSINARAGVAGFGVDAPQGRGQVQPIAPASFLTAAANYVANYQNPLASQAPGVPQISLTAPATQTNRLTGDQPTFSNPQTGQLAPQVKPQTAKKVVPDTEFIKNHAINIEASLGAGRPQFISPEVANVLGIEDVLKDTANSGYIFDGATWRPDPYAQAALAVGADASYQYSGQSGPVRRPPISYRRRTAYELTKGDEVLIEGVADQTVQDFYGTSGVVNWRVSFA